MSEPSEFLEKLRPGGPWVLTAIIPDGGTTTITAKTAKEVDLFVRRNNGKKNLYYSVNPTRGDMTKKAAKTDIAAIEFFLSDLDPNEDESSEDAKARYLAALETQQPACTAVVDSGNGLQALWRLAEPIKLAEPITVKGKNVFPTETAALIADVEARVEALMLGMGSKAGTQNIDRILRLPGTTNLPNNKKRENGRVECPTRLIRFNGATCSPDDFPQLGQQHQSKPPPPEGGIDWDKVAERAGWLRTVDDLPKKFSAKGKKIIAHGGTLADLNAECETQYKSWSDVSFALAAILKADKRFAPEQIAAALMCDLPCNQHVTKQNEAERRRAIERMLKRSFDRDGEPNWRERSRSGGPLPSVYNAKLAITTIGIECSYDTFHGKMLIGFKNDSFRHELNGEVTDNTVLLLRDILSEKFGFDLLATPTLEAVNTLALKRCFDPVCDMLADAEKNWDGVERLERMAVDYFNTEDTPLNRACVRKTMIAAVRRARQPGCKFDNIPVLESEEGWRKSGAWRELAGEDNFSDQTILGASEREVQELLGPVWIHESADLSGMKRADIERVKAFASRQEDIARPAYGRLVKKQKRHAINVGTTNDEEYLQSQTGNRRFWPLKVLAPIDIEQLRCDRLQLWGEAARYESKGESISLPEELWPAAREAQEQRRAKDPWEDILANIPKTIRVGEYDRTIIHVLEQGQEFVSSADLLAHVLGMNAGVQDRRHTMRLSTVMKKVGWERPDRKTRVAINGKQVRGYVRQRGQQPLPLAGS